MRIQISILLVALLAFTACKKENKEAEDIQSVEQNEVEASKISIAPLSNSPAYTDAKLILDTPETMKSETVGEISFPFQVENYELGAQTEGPNAEKLANSKKGQHIHFILNNQPYSAHYTADIVKEIPEGVHHLVAFLSRSFHESVKNEQSVVVKKLVVGDVKDDSSMDMDAPTLIYSRPKGTYSGSDTKHILLDFFVLNTELSENGNHVVATVNDQVFKLTKWQPYLLSGLPLGEVEINLQLVDKDGVLIPGPFNSVTRTVTLTE